MNMISQMEMDVLQSCFENGISVRKAAGIAKVNRGTVLRYYHRFRTGQLTLRLSDKVVSTKITGLAWQTISMVARRLELGLPELVAMILEAAADQGEGDLTKMVSEDV